MKNKIGGRLAGWLAGWLAGGLAGWVAGWLVGNSDNRAQLSLAWSLAELGNFILF